MTLVPVLVGVLAEDVSIVLPTIVFVSGEVRRRRILLRRRVRRVDAGAKHHFA